MSRPLPSTARVAWLLTRLRLRRLLNLSGGLRRSRPARAGTPAKKRTPALLTAAVALVMATGAVQLAWQAVNQLARLVGDDGRGAAFGPALQHALSVELLVLMLASTLLALGARELAQADWDLEWLVTLPAETGALLWSRIAERTVVNPFGMLGLWPACSVLAWEGGWRHAAPAVGLLVALPLLALTAMLRTLVDTGLRLKLSPSRLRNLEAGITVGSLMVFFFALSPAMPMGGAMLAAMAQGVPEAIRWTPPGLAMQVFAARSVGPAAGHAALLLAEVGLLLWIGMRWLRALLAGGVVAAGVRESGRAAARPAAGRAVTRGQAVARLLRLSPVQRRELLLLARDRSFLVQTMLLPVLIVGLQWLAQGHTLALGSLWQSPQAVAAAGFGMAAYVLLLSAFQTVANERGAVWLLYTFTRPIDAVLLDKARLWGVLALAYPAIGFAVLLVLGPAPDLATLGLAAMVALGVPIYSAIAVALGIFASDPLATDARQRLKPTYVYLYTLLSGLYAYALVAPRWWQSLAFVVLAALLAQALWQKACDQLPSLLDPVSGPPARVSTADGLIAAMLFFVLQVFTTTVLQRFLPDASVPPVVIGFAVAGALTYVGVRLTQWRSRMRELPAMLGPGWPRALLTGLGFGLGVALVGLAYLQVLRALDLVDTAWSDGSAPATAVAVSWLLVLGVLAAPLFEEYIFRGLIFGGLRRSMRLLPAAAASAAVFALVHPPLSALPVFALGLAAAWAYARSRLLLAPMAVHAVYNAAVLGWQHGLGWGG